MGVVYEAVDSVIERTVAIKTIRKDDLDPDEAAEHSRRFLIEAKAAGKLNHPNIISLYDHGDEAGMAYIVMELVQGRELQHYFDEKYRFSLSEVVRLMGELLDALGYSHRRGVVHRDVKPANIFITETGSVKLGDFGIARIESTQKTRAGALMGTPSYMSPEQIRGEPADARSDLYAAGVVLFQFLTGERPFAGNMLAMAMKVLNDPVPRASSLNAEVSPALEAVIDRALAKQAGERFQSAAEFWQALAEAVGLVVTPLPALSAQGAGSGTLGPGDRGRSLFGGTTGWGHGGLGTVPPVTGPAQPGPPIATPTLAAADVEPAAAAAAPVSAAPGGVPRALVGVAGVALLVVAAAWWWTQGRNGLHTQAGAGAATAPTDHTDVPPSAPATRPGVAPLPEPPRPAATEAPAPAAPTPERLPAAPPPMDTPPAPAPAPVPAPAPPPAAADSRPAPRPPRATPAAEPTPRSAPTVSAPPPAARAARSPRCSDILQKASLEALTAEEGAYLRKECQ